MLNAFLHLLTLSTFPSQEAHQIQLLTPSEELMYRGPAAWG